LQRLEGESHPKERGNGFMMVREGDYVAIFNSIHRVMQAEKRLKERRMPILLIPAPRALKSDCGLALRYAAVDREGVEGALAEEGLMPEEIYVKNGGEFVRCGQHESDPQFLA
jgi:hypothetical protein